MADVRLLTNYRSAVVCLLCAVYLADLTGAVVKHGVDKSICDPKQIPNSVTPKRPMFPNTYRVNIEANIENRNYTTDYSEYYDGVHNMGVDHQWFLGFHVFSIYSPATNELFTIETQTGSCVTDDLEKAGPKYIFGYKTSSTNPKVGKIYSANGALRFGYNGTSEQYMGRTAIRGVAANYWKSCMYWPDMDATMEVHWYFADPTHWTPATGKDLPSPLRCQVHGKVWSGTPHLFNHTYEFSNFHIGDEKFHPQQNVFETPPGVICPHRKNTKPLPTPTNYFTFTSETLNLDFQTIGFIKEYYSHDMNLVRYDYKPDPDNFDQYGQDFLSEVHDFSEGIAYIRDPRVGNCSVTTISSRGIGAELANPGDPTHVRIRTTKEFFDFDRTQYQYEGARSVRGMMADVWIAVRSDWPPGTHGMNSTWEWYFATKGWRESTGHKYVFGMPLMLKVHSDSFGDFVYNTYNFDEEKPAMWNFDISKCYNYTNRRDFAFKIPGSFQHVVARGLSNFKYRVLLAVHKASTVSSLRITNIQIDYDVSNILVSMTMLGTPTIQGDVLNPVKQTTLAMGAILLTNAINSNQLKIFINSTMFPTPITLIAQPYSLSQSSHTVKKAYYTPPAKSTTYSAGDIMTGATCGAGDAHSSGTPDLTFGFYEGAVAGLGVAMAVVFFIFGFACMYIYYRKNGGSFTKNSLGAGFEPQKFDNENTSTPADT